MRVVICEPNRFSEIINIENSLKMYQSVVGGNIQAIYPFDDPVALVCNENAKIEGLELNRCLKKDGVIYDIIAGTFFICGFTEDDFCELTESQADAYKKAFRFPQYFLTDISGNIIAINRYTEL